MKPTLPPSAPPTGHTVSSTNTHQVVIPPPVSITTTSNNIISSNNNHNVENDPFFIPSQAIPVQTIAVAEREIAPSEVHHTHHPHPASAPIIITHTKSTLFWVAIVFAMMLVSLATGVGVYCGTGNCGDSNINSTVQSSSNDNTNENAPALPPITVTVSAPISVTPVVAPPNNNNTTFAPITTTNTRRPTISPTNTPTMNPTSPFPTNAPTIDPTLHPVMAPNAPQPINEQWATVCEFVEITDVAPCQSATFIETSMAGTIPTEIGLMTQLNYLD
jgi:hypothetical protein